MASLRSSFLQRRHGIVSLLLCLAACGSDGGSKKPGDGDHTDNPIQTGDGGTDDGGMVIMPRPDGTCDVVEHCLPPADACQKASCVEHKCVAVPVAANEPASQQVPGDCKQLKCDSQGRTVPWADPSDVPADDGKPCTEELCVGVQPTHQMLPVGAVLPAAAQVAGDCREFVCGEGNTLASHALPSDIPAHADGVCQVPACDGDKPASKPAQPGTMCGEINVCDPMGACTSCRADYAPCTDNWQCCGGVCGMAGCTPTLCRPGEKSCRGNKLVQCAADGQSDSVVQDCGSTMHCDAELLSCQAGVCTPGEALCSNERAVVCDESGNIPATGGTDCAADGKTCVSGKCEAKQAATTEVIGGTTLYEDTETGASTNLEGIRVTTARTLTELDAYVAVPASGLTITFLVYESTDQATFTLLKKQTVGALEGEGYVSSGPLSVPLVSGRDYAVGTSWSSATPIRYAWAATATKTPLTFGELLGDAYGYVTPPESFMVGPAANPLAIQGWNEGACGLRVHTTTP
jgi:hypothetical protein